MILERVRIDWNNYRENNEAQTTIGPLINLCIELAVAYSVARLIIHLMNTIIAGLEKVVNLLFDKLLSFLNQPFG